MILGQQPGTNSGGPTYILLLRESRFTEKEGRRWSTAQPRARRTIRMGKWKGDDIYALDTGPRERWLYRKGCQWQ